MNYIEEMMKIVGIKPYFIYHYKLSNVKDEIAHVSTIVLERERISHFHKFGYGKICKVVNCGLPDFTAEKQLELIKLISKNQIGKDYKILEIDRDEIDNLYYFSLTNKEDKCQSTYVSNQDFAQALAQLTTELMNTGKLDKGKVKEVLQC